MKRSRAGIALIIIGIIVVILSPVFKWAIGPSLKKIPDNIDTTSIYEGTLKLFVDPTTLAILPPELAVSVPLQITRKDVSQPKKSTSSVALVKETANALGPAGKSFLSYTKYFAMDRKTAKNVPDQGSNINRTDYFILLPMDVQKKSYLLFDDDTAKSGDAKFVKTVTLNGDKTKNATGMVFKASGTDKMVNPPLGLPSEITGAEAKAIIGNPNLALVDTQKYPIVYLKETTATIVAEQRTGAFVNIPSYSETYFVDASGFGEKPIKLATLSYSQVPDNVRAVVDDAAKSFGLLDLVNIWIPVALLVIGLILLIIGLALFFRKKTA